MDDATQPEWMKNFVPKPLPPKPASRWEKGMPSPNPAGRPKGVLDRRSRITKVLMDDAPEVARVVIDAALEGDMQAANLVLSRCAPAIKQQAERVQFTLDPDRPLGAQARQVMDAVAAGEVDPDTGKQLIDCLKSVANIKATEDLEARIIMLEAKQL